MHVSISNVSAAMLEVFGYYLVFIPLSIWWGNELSGIDRNEYIVLGGTIFKNFVTEFLFNRFVVFHETITGSLCFTKRCIPTTSQKRSVKAKRGKQ